MTRLKDRNKQTPGGHKFYDAILKYRARPWASVEEIASGLIAARKANPALTQQHGWSTDDVTVRNEVDEAIALHCQQMGWLAYLADGGPPPVPFNQAQRPQNQRLLGRLRNVVAGASVIVDFVKSREEAVPIKLSTDRAATCVVCPKNSKPNSLLDVFTTSASEAIRKALEQGRSWNLTTPHDGEVGICSACLCPIRLMVHMPLKVKLASMSQETKDNLDENCWVLLEEKSLPTEAA